MEKKCDLLLLDEGHRLKNKKIKTFKSISQFRCQRRVLITANPLQNTMDEFYTCISCINPRIFPSIEMFMRLFGLPILLYITNQLKGNEEETRRAK